VRARERERERVSEREKANGKVRSEILNGLSLAEESCRQGRD